VKELTLAIAQHKNWPVFIFWDLMLSYEFTTRLANYNSACHFVNLHRQMKTRLALSLEFQGYYPKQTHYTTQLKQERRLEK
jgi:hypothetical protein